MKISRVILESSIDYDGKYGPVFFTAGCNFNCGFCYNTNGTEMSQDRLEKILGNLRIKTKIGWYNGATICGGEPTLQLDLANFAGRLKDLELAVKLDTNGSNPAMLLELKKQNIIDYVAMDIKGTKRLYHSIVGKDYIDLREIEKSMNLVTQFPDYEFRTTIAPIMGEKGLGFMNKQEAREMAEWIVNVTGSNEHKYYLQKFLPVKGSMRDTRFENFSETSDEKMKELHSEIIKYLPNCKIR